MRQPNLSTELLRSFITVVEKEGFIRASEHLYKTQSTISQHIRRLENELNTPLFMPEGRRRVLTPAGHLMLGYAKRLLALQQEAQLALKQTTVEGEICLGVSRSIGEQIIPELLVQFARFYPGLRLLVETGYSNELIQRYNKGDYDLLLTLERNPLEGEVLGIEPMVWIGSVDFTWEQTKPLPIAGYAAPCQFREAGIQALNQQGIAWQMIYSTNSLSSLMAAVRLGLAVTVRARSALINGTEIITSRLALPALPDVHLVLRNRALSEVNQLVENLLKTEALNVT